MADEQIPHLVAVDRIVKLPIVESSWNIASDIYTRIKVRQYSSLHTFYPYLFAI
jgi:hypothetical protein